MRALALFVSILALLPPPHVSLAVAAPARARDIDARHCLDLGDIRAIARCAEPYRRPARMAGRNDAGTTAAPAAPPPAAAPAPALATGPAAARPAPRVAAAPAPRAERKRRGREVDARHCLDLADDRAIARCAERYR